MADPTPIRWKRGVRRLQAAIAAWSAGDVTKGRQLGAAALLDNFGPEIRNGRMKNKLRRAAGRRTT